MTDIIDVLIRIDKIGDKEIDNITNKLRMLGTEKLTVMRYTDKEGQQIAVWRGQMASASAEARNLDQVLAQLSTKYGANYQLARKQVIESQRQVGIAGLLVDRLKLFVGRSQEAQQAQRRMQLSSVALSMSLLGVAFSAMSFLTMIRMYFMGLLQYVQQADTTITGIMLGFAKGVAMAAGAFKQLDPRTLQFGKAWKEIWDSLQIDPEKLAEKLLAAQSELQAAMTLITAPIANAVSDLVLNVLSDEDVVQAIKEIGQAIAEFIGDPQMVEVIKTAIKSFRDFFKLLADNRAIIYPILKGLAKFAPYLVMIGTAAMIALPFFSILTAALAFGPSSFLAAIGFIISNLPELILIIGSVVFAIGTFTDALQPLYDWLWNKLSGAIDWISEKLSGLKDWFGKIYDAVNTLTGGFLGRFIDAIERVASKLGWLREIIDGVKNAISGILNTFGLGNIFGGVTNVVPKVGATPVSPKTINVEQNIYANVYKEADYEDFSNKLISDFTYYIKRNGGGL